MPVWPLNHGKRPKSWRVNGKIIHSYMLAKIQRHVGEGSGQDYMPGNFSQRVNRKNSWERTPEI